MNTKKVFKAEIESCFEKLHFGIFGGLKNLIEFFELFLAFFGNLDIFKKDNLKVYNQFKIIIVDT